ncbi:MAG TPA: heparinase II/III family protein, partial [Thermoguttaceae bacterium]|nr:heparinase II/III family protein [Thermoguttaceae bacterium]
TGYDHLRGRPRHRRAVEIDANHDLTITDRFTGRGRHHVSVGLLIAPGWQVEPAENGWRLRGGGHSLRISLESPPTVRGDVEQAAYHPEYGLEQSTLRLVWRGDVEFPITMTVRVVPE